MELNCATQVDADIIFSVLKLVGYTEQASSSSNNIQDQYLIITDIYGVREKGVWLKKCLIPNPNTVTGLPVA